MRRFVLWLGLLLAIGAGVALAAACPHCGEVYGEGMGSGADGAYISRIRAEHEASCSSRRSAASDEGAPSARSYGVATVENASATPVSYQVLQTSKRWTTFSLAPGESRWHSVTPPQSQTILIDRGGGNLATYTMRYNLVTGREPTVADGARCVIRDTAGGIELTGAGGGALPAGSEPAHTHNLLCKLARAMGRKTCLAGKGNLPVQPVAAFRPFRPAVEVSLDRARSLMERGRYAEAIRELLYAIRIDRHREIAHRAYFELARIERLQGRQTEAERYLREAVRARPDFAPARDELAAVQRERPVPAIPPAVRRPLGVTGAPFVPGTTRFYVPPVGPSGPVSGLVARDPRTGDPIVPPRFANLQRVRELERARTDARTERLSQERALRAYERLLARPDVPAANRVEVERKAVAVRRTVAEARHEEARLNDSIAETVSFAISQEEIDAKRGARR